MTYLPTKYQFKYYLTDTDLVVMLFQAPNGDAVFLFSKMATWILIQLLICGELEFDLECSHDTVSYWNVSLIVYNFNYIPSEWQQGRFEITNMLIEGTFIWKQDSQIEGYQ
jgi:hypothetical protein